VKPSTIVANSLAKAIPGPNIPQVVINRKGLMRGEAVRNAIMSASGTPEESIAAKMGMTA